MIEIFFDHMKNVRNFIFGCVLVFFSFFHAKSGTTNNHRNGSSIVPYYSPLSRDSRTEKFFKNLSREKPV